MKKYSEFILEQSHLVNTKDIETIAKDIVEYFFDQFSKEHVACVYDFKSGLFKKELGCIAIIQDDLGNDYARLYHNKDNSDLDMMKFYKKQDEEGFEGVPLNYAIAVNEKSIETMKEMDNAMRDVFNDKEYNENRSHFYSSVCHELTHLYELLNGYKIKKKEEGKGLESDEDLLIYYFTKTEIDARINLTYHYCKEHSSIKKTLKSSKNLTDTINELVNDEYELEDVTHISDMKRLVNKYKSYQKKFDNYKKRIYDVIYKLATELKEE